MILHQREPSKIPACVHPGIQGDSEYAVHTVLEYGAASISVYGNHTTRLDSFIHSGTRSQLGDDCLIHASRLRLRWRFADLLQERDEHRLVRVAPSIVTEANFVKVHLEILRADCVVCAANVVFDETPEPFNAVRVNVAHHIHRFAVIDPLVCMAGVVHVADAVVDSRFISEYRADGHYVFLDERKHFAAPRGFDCAGNGAALALHDTEYRPLPFVAIQFPACAVLCTTAVKHLVDLDWFVTVERSLVVQH